MGPRATDGLLRAVQLETPACDSEPALLLYDEVYGVMLGGHHRMVAVSDDRDELVLAGREALERVCRVAGPDVHDVLCRGWDHLPIRSHGGVEEEMIVAYPLRLRGGRLLDGDRAN